MLYSTLMLPGLKHHSIAHECDKFCLEELLVDSGAETVHFEHLLIIGSVLCHVTDPDAMYAAMPASSFSDW